MADNTRKNNQNDQRQRQGEKVGQRGGDIEQDQDRQGVGKPHQQREEADQDRDRMSQPTGGDLSEISKGVSDEDDLDEDDLDDDEDEDGRITQRTPSQEG